MKNLRYLDIEYFTWFKDIISFKKEVSSLNQPELLANVEARYLEYVKNFNSQDLIQIKKSIYKKNHPELTGCYKSKTKIVSQLLSKIKDLQSDEAKSKCQYCGIGKPKTIDHYLPISLFPEYAVLAINLLPCCNDCNKKKDNYWKSDECRGILNFYVDSIPNKQFIQGKISTSNSLPIISYHFNFDGIDSGLKNIITSHYSRLDLFERYQKESADEISEICRQLNIYAKEKTSKEISQLLQDDSEDLQARYGKNYWKAVLFEALANNKSFLKNYRKYLKVPL